MNKFQCFFTLKTALFDVLSACGGGSSSWRPLGPFSFHYSFLLMLSFRPTYHISNGASDLFKFGQEIVYPILLNIDLFFPLKWLSFQSIQLFKELKWSNHSLDHEEKHHKNNGRSWEIWFLFTTANGSSKICTEFSHSFSRKLSRHFFSFHSAAMVHFFVCKFTLFAHFWIDLHIIFIYIFICLVLFFRLSCCCFVWRAQGVLHFFLWRTLRMKTLFSFEKFWLSLRSSKYSKWLKI